MYQDYDHQADIELIERRMNERRNNIQQLNAEIKRQSGVIRNDQHIFWFMTSIILFFFLILMVAFGSHQCQLHF